MFFCALKICISNACLFILDMACSHGQSYALGLTLEIKTWSWLPAKGVVLILKCSHLVFLHNIPLNLEIYFYNIPTICHWVFMDHLPPHRSCVPLPHRFWTHACCWKTSGGVQWVLQSCGWLEGQPDHDTAGWVSLGLPSLPRTNTLHAHYQRNEVEIIVNVCLQISILIPVSIWNHNHTENNYHSTNAWDLPVSQLWSRSCWNIAYCIRHSQCVIHSGLQISLIFHEMLNSRQIIQSATSQVCEPILRPTTGYFNECGPNARLTAGKDLCRGSHVLSAMMPAREGLWTVSAEYRATAPPWENPPTTMRSREMPFFSSSDIKFCTGSNHEEMGGVRLGGYIDLFEYWPH